jgi:mannose-6-phosphate isomerase-like protein (cupin superfamily)
MNDSIPASLLEIHETQNPGFQALIDSDCWRVAILMFAPDLTPQHLVEFQRHNESDEVFVLLSGRCILFLGEGENTVTQVFAYNLEPLKLYKVQRRAWHAHVQSADAKLLIVENRNTSRLNSPRIKITPEQREDILGLTRLIWGNT